MISITVIVTTHNLEAYLEDCIRDLSHQTFQDFEVLFVDDASTDQTRKIIDRLCENDSKKYKKLFLDKNLGFPGLVRNCALDSGLINGEFILFLDGDDRYEPSMLERMIVSARENPSSQSADIVICSYDRIDARSGKRVANEMRGFPHTVYPSSSNDLFAFVNTAPWNKLWKKSLIYDLRFSSFRVGEEVLFSINAYQRAEEIVFIDDILVHYYVRSGSVISSTDEETIWKFAKELEEEWNRASDNKELIELTIFLHIGLSMALRAASNPNIDIRKFIREFEQWCGKKFDWFANNRYFSFCNLSSHGIRGIIIWISFKMYTCFSISTKVI